MTKIFINEKELNEQASLVILLDRLGYKPVKHDGNEQLYFNMLGSPGLKPSFVVNDTLGSWYDRTTKKGGSITDFALAYWKPSSIGEVIERINREFARDPERKPVRPRLPVKIPHYVVEEVKNIGAHPAITSYLKSLGIFEAALICLKEVYYYTEDQKRVRKYFFAAGWQNDGGGWEVRSKYFKGCFGCKSLNFIRNDKKSIVVFEDFTNYLSWLQVNPSAKQSALILNNTHRLQTAISIAIEFSSIDLYFSRDRQGVSATAEFVKALPYASDRSSQYVGFTDYNKCLVISASKKIPAIFK